MKKDVYILSIETSCDETSMAIIKNGKEVDSLTILTQMDTHASFGGVVPEIASRMHTENITMVLEETLRKASVKIEEIDAIAVTYAPGLLGSLLVGVECAKVLSLVYNKPLIAVNHTMGHIYANNIEHGIKYPSLALIVSGGHTDLLILKSESEMEILGSTIDDSIGEVFDKVARILKMKYPGGPNIERAAKEGNPSYELPRPMLDNSYNFSYSGLKSFIINLVHNETQRGNEINVNNLACSFQQVAVEELTRKVELAIKNTGIKNMVLAGGVSANTYLREQMQRLCEKYKVEFHVPNILYCTDNAAMIGCAAYPLYKQKKFADFTLNAKSSENIKQYIEKNEKKKTQI
ncbi:MAG: tRNA (adenosine(37)-N6)-threonylcarbamoyltransferase complex transferase subunit TsaD [Bacilli bacterium]|nr:tRNA (adenosine(37)-N6)-threonylcarbamoyltransferase complex transferase subunit TsaD [Bacilli bacterium]